MCGRYKISTKAPQILAAFDVDVADAYDLKARFNVAPTDPVPCVRLEDGKRKLVPLRWGLLPFWAKTKSEGARMINARVETVLEKKHFAEAFEKRRCLVVSDGFYEWRGSGKEKQPYLICFEDKHVFAYAGLWARWHPKDTAKDGTDVVETVTVITMPPNKVAAQVHDRMPLILDPAVDADKIAAWLDVEKPVDIEAFGAPRELPGLTMFAVDKRVGNVRNDEPALAEPIPDQPHLL